MSALKPLTESSQNCLNNTVKHSEVVGEAGKKNSALNDENRTIVKSPVKNYKNQAILNTPKVVNRYGKASDTTIQMDLTQGEKPPITSTPLVNNYVHNDTSQSEKMNSGFSHNTTSLTSVGAASFIEKDELVDKVGRLVEESRRRIGDSVLLEMDEINEHTSNEDLMKCLTDALVRIKTNLNYYKIEAKLVVQSNEDLYSRNAVETKLMKKELEKLKFDHNLDKDSSASFAEDDTTKLQKYNELKRIARDSIANFEDISIKNRQLSKKALKYKVKYNQAKELLAEREKEIKTLKKSLKSPPRFKIVPQYTPEKPKSHPQSHSRPPNDSTMSPDHTIIAQSPATSSSSDSNPHNMAENRLLPPPVSSRVTLPNAVRGYDTLNMLASQALIASSTSYERALKARKGNDNAAVPTAYSMFDDHSDSKKPTKLPGINHLLSKPIAYLPRSKISHPALSDSDKESNLNSNDTIDEDQTY